MYKIDQIDYHYYSHLTEGINELLKDGKYSFVQIVELLPSGYKKRMHRAIVLLRENGQNEQEIQSKLIEDCKTKADEVQKEFDNLSKFPTESSVARKIRMHDTAEYLLLRCMTPDERLEAITCFCHFCGEETPDGKRCYCMKDE